MANNTISALGSLKNIDNTTIKAQVVNKVMEQSIGAPGSQSLTNAITLDTIKQNSTRQAAEGKAGVSEALAVAANATSTSSEIELKHRYLSDSGGRLVNFEFADGSDDDARRAFMQLQGNTESIKTLVSGENASLLGAVYEHLVNGYTSVIITGIQENLQERQHILPTTGDSFAATFSGKEPQLLMINGLLPFDAANDDRSWFIAFMNAYNTFIRASVLAKFKCSIRLVFPDFSSYTLYPTNINCTLMSDNDTLIPFTMTAVVMDSPSTRAYGYKSSILIPQTTIEQVNAETSAETLAKQIESEVTKDPKDVGKTEKKKNFWETINDGINNVVGEINKFAQSKTMQSINQGFAILNEVEGAVNILKGEPYGKRATYANSNKKKK